MQDMMEKAEAWFEKQRRAHLSKTVQYVPVVGVSRPCAATFVTGRWEAITKDGAVVRMETRDFLIHRDDLPQDPKRGDRVLIEEYGYQKTYETVVPHGANNFWSWFDRSQTIRRVHTQAVETVNTGGAVNLMVRGFGVSSAAAITDQQILSDLSLDMAATWNTSKQLLAGGQYLYAVLPAAWGSPTFRINGFTSTAWETTTRTITFPDQAAASYTIYRSTYAITGTPLLEVS
jgi:hypothetical protein